MMIANAEIAVLRRADNGNSNPTLVVLVGLVSVPLVESVLVDVLVELVLVVSVIGLVDDDTYSKVML